MRRLWPKRSPKNRYYLETMIIIASILVATFLAFLCVFSVVYNRTASELTNSVVAESIQLLNLSAQDVSSAFSREWLLMTENDFVNDTKAHFNSLHKDDTSYDIYSRLLLTKKQLASRFLSSDIFKNILILYIDGEQDYLCASSFISNDFERDYNNGLFSFGNMSYPEFISMIESNSKHRHDRGQLNVGQLDYTYNEGYSNLAGYFVYPFTYSNTGAQIYALLHIDLVGLQRAMSGFRYAGDYFMLSSRNNTVFSTAPDVHLTSSSNGLYSDGHSDTIYLCASIDKLGLSCYVSLNQDAIYDNISNFAKLLHFLSAAFVVLILLLVVLLFLRWHYPVIRIARDIDLNDKSKAPLERINSHITNLKQENERYAKRIEALEPAVRSALLSRFYQGTRFSEKESSLLQDIIPITQDAAFRCVVVGCLSSPAATNQTLQNVLLYISKRLPAFTLPAFINGQIVGLIQMSHHAEEDGSVILTQLKELLFQMNADFSTDKPLYAIGISDVYVGPDSVPTAYHEAHTGWMDALTWQNASVVFAGAANVGGSYHLSYSQLDDIYRSLKAGDAPTAVDVFDRIAAEHFSPENGQGLRRLFCQQFFYDILGILTRVSVQYNIHSVLEPLQTRSLYLPISQQLKLFRDALFECAELIPTSEENNSIMTQIQAFCNEQFSNTALSLSMVADHFHLSESNLSKSFKSHTGINFSNYVENLRIRKAEALLEEGKMSVKTIATSVGYQNVATFYNAFRRNHNCTPTQWLEHIKP